jgi:hypothetical protein
MAVMEALIQMARQLVKETLPRAGVLLHPRHVAIPSLAMLMGATEASILMARLPAKATLRLANAVLPLRRVEIRSRVI